MPGEGGAPNHIWHSELTNGPPTANNSRRLSGSNESNLQRIVDPNSEGCLGPLPLRLSRARVLNEPLKADSLAPARARSRSTLHRRSASNSPRRSPQSAASKTGTSIRVPRMLSIRSTVCPCHRCRGAPFDLGGLDGVGRVAEQQLPFHGLPEGLLKDLVQLVNGAGRKAALPVSAESHARHHHEIGQDEERKGEDQRLGNGGGSEAWLVRSVAAARHARGDVPPLDARDVHDLRAGVASYRSMKLPP